MKVEIKAIEYYLPPNTKSTESLAKENPDWQIDKIRKKTGIKVPNELSIIGFDEFETAEILDPPLTTVAQPVGMFGSIGMEMLFKRIKGQDIDTKNIVLTPELLVRESCMKIS